MNEARAGQANEPVNVGLELQRLRLRQTRTIDAIADALKLTPDMVSHLENNAFDKLPNQVFVRGYIRNYLNLLDVPKEHADDLIRHFNANIGRLSLEASERSQISQQRRHEFDTRKIKLMAGQQQYKIDTNQGRWKIWLGLIAIITLALMAWLLFMSPEPTRSVEAESDGQIDLEALTFQDLEPEQSSDSGVVVGTVPEVNSPTLSTDIVEAQAPNGTSVLQNNSLLDLSGSEPQSLLVIAEQPALPIIESTATSLVVESAPNQVVLSPEAPIRSQPDPIAALDAPDLFAMGSLPETASVLQPGDAVQFRLSFASESWVRITDNEDLNIASGLYDSGDDLNLRGMAPIQMHIGNSIDTAVIYQNEIVDYSRFTSSNVARFILNADGSLERGSF